MKTSLISLHRQLRPITLLAITLVLACHGILVSATAAVPVAWGLNTAGELGNGTTGPIGSLVPEAVTTAGTPLAGKTIIALATGGVHSLALCSDGTLVAWGANNYGQLGNGTTGSTGSSVPGAVTTAGTPLAGKTVIAISAGGFHSLALCSDGTLAAWGKNVYGQLGNGTTGPIGSLVPGAVTTAGTPLAGKTVIAISAGAAHNLALCSDGTLAAWGYNLDGELGNGTTGSVGSLVPGAVTTAGTPLAGKTVTAVSAGE